MIARTLAQWLQTIQAFCVRRHPSTNPNGSRCRGRGVDAAVRQRFYAAAVRELIAPVNLDPRLMRGSDLRINGANAKQSRFELAFRYSF